MNKLDDVKERSYFQRPQHCIELAVGNGTLKGDLHIPSGSESLCIFVHGSGSSRLSPRNRYVADLLNSFGFSTLVFDLLTEREEAVDVCTARYRFNIELLAERLEEVTRVLANHESTAEMSLGYFGASTGAAAALLAATRIPRAIGAIVSRGGRPDLVMEHLASVKSPTLLIVGEHDREVLKLNQLAYEQLNVEKSLEVVPGATHLFEEPGALETVADLAGNWFLRYLQTPRGDASNLWQETF